MGGMLTDGLAIGSFPGMPFVGVNECVQVQMLAPFPNNIRDEESISGAVFDPIQALDFVKDV